ncbi:MULTISPECIES: hypothetical protein [Niastella]|uniref:Uncharacterized protein n=1 Tax=Niastella soli TaxID=2821487 RepID=A0ABS3YZZ6_9BACT|nr:hypothetical protein [Niastella soli]MBO9203495.1 hypothetical protein [Niastella soli]
MKKKSPITRSRYFNDPVFERSRENNTEFTRAAKANRVLRHAFKPGMLNKADRYVSGRLTKTMFRILQTDPINERGERRVPQGVLNFLGGFNFNRDTNLQTILRAPYSITFNQEAMLATISIPSFIPRAMIDTESDANAFMLTAMAASLHFEKESYPVEPVQTDLLDMSLQQHEDLQLQLPVIGHQPDHSVVVALGIEFFQSALGQIKPLDKKHNALAVVKVF